MKNYILILVILILCGCEDNNLTVQTTNKKIEQVQKTKEQIEQVQKSKEQIEKVRIIEENIDLISQKLNKVQLSDGVNFETKGCEIKVNAMSSGGFAYTVNLHASLLDPSSGYKKINKRNWDPHHFIVYCADGENCIHQEGACDTQKSLYYSSYLSSNFKGVSSTLKGLIEACSSLGKTNDWSCGNQRYSRRHTQKNDQAKDNFIVDFSTGNYTCKNTSFRDKHPMCVKGSTPWLGVEKCMQTIRNICS